MTQPTITTSGISPPPPPDGPRPPLIDRVAKLEQLVAQLASLHNAFAADVARELGLGE